MSNGPFARAGIWWGHHAPSILAVIVVIILASTFFSGVGAHYQAGGAALLFVFVIATWFKMRKHDRRPCERCLAGMPLNPGEVAKSHRRYFATVHAGENKLLVLGYMALLIGSDIIITLPLGLPSAVNWILLVFWGVMQTSMLYLLRAYVMHHRLQPWCPWCAGGNGEDDRVETPDPVPTGVA